MPVSKFVRVAVEGATTDGRNIQRSWLEQMAKNFNRTKYGARIWLEHIRGVLADSSFKALGDVVEVKAEEVEIDGVKKMALFAKLDVTDEMVAMNKKRQKIYTSMEIDPDFAKSGEAYLIGLGVTDSPASLGTEALQFAAQAKTNPLSSKKQNPDNMFTEAVEIELELEEQPIDNGGNTLLSKVKDLLGLKNKTDEAKFSDIGEAVEAVATSQKTLLDLFDANTRQFASLQADIKKLSDELAASQKSFNDLKADLEKTPGQQHKRQIATGGNGTVATDC